MLNLHQTTLLAVILVIQGAVCPLFDSAPLSLEVCYGSPSRQATAYQYYAESVFGGAVVAICLLCLLLMSRDWQGRCVQKFSVYALFVCALVLCGFATADLQSKSNFSDHVIADENLSERQLQAIQQSWEFIEVWYVATFLVLFITLVFKARPQRRLKHAVEGLLLFTMLLFLFFSVRLLWYIYGLMPPECNFLTPLPSSSWIWAVLILTLQNNKDENEEECEEDTKATNFSLKEPLLSHEETTGP